MKDSLNHPIRVAQKIFYFQIQKSSEFVDISLVSKLRVNLIGLCKTIYSIYLFSFT